MVPGADGFHHRGDEAELVALVKQAYREGRQLRGRGAAHSVAHAPYTDPLRVVDPSDPTGTAKLKDSLLYRLWRAKGWAISDTGGITHQT